MLKYLTIRNFAIIDKLELEFENGMTVLTGETGAGKSILLGALNLVLGDRADTESIRQPAEFAEIVAEFDIQNLTKVSSWLVAQELNSDNECILRRRLSKDGRSRASINSTPVNLQTIKELAEMLIDIHGQHEHQSIMKSAVQRQLLDDYAGHTELLEQVSNRFVELKLVDEQFQHLSQSTNQRNDRLDLLRFQTQELDNLDLAENEYQELNTQHKRLANAETLRNSVQQAIYTLSEDDNSNVQSAISITQNSLAGIAEIDERLLPTSELLLTAQIQIDECCSLLKHYHDSIEVDSNLLEEIESRIQIIIDLSRKHQVTPQLLHDTHQQLLKELSDIDHADERLDELKIQLDKLALEYTDACQKLTKSRNVAASKLNKKISQSMQTLGMSGGKFVIENHANKDNKRRVHGLDDIDFTVTANSGQSCKSISKVASGGELARISLAIQMIIAKTSKIPSLIFDEVDSGVGGGIAEIVGQSLRALGKTNQVICITHLPQVASQGHHHLRVEKQTKNKKTESQVITLDKKQRVEEIARMLSGIDITQQSLAHAEEMLEKNNT